MAFWRRCCRTTGCRRTRTSRGEGYVYGQEKGNEDRFDDRTYLESRPSEGDNSGGTVGTPLPPSRGDPFAYACSTMLMIGRALLGLVNRRDVLSLAHENLNAAQNSTLRKLSDVEVENLQLHRKNKDLVQELLSLTKNDESWREKLEDADLRAQLDQVRTDYKKSKAKWDTMKSVASAIVVGSGVNWAEDEDLLSLVLDESDD